MEGKFERKSMPTSHTPPAVAVGDMISIDSNVLAVKSPGGNLSYIDSLDEFSGDRQVTPCKSLSSADIFKAIMELVHTRYNAYGHRVARIMADSLPAFEPVISMLGAVGILMTLVAPGQHAQRVERSIGSSAAWRRAVLASLPYILPLQYDLYLLMWIADVANGMPNVHSHPTVPDVLITGRRRVEHYKYPELRFGQTCMVQVALDKRQTEARLSGMAVKDVHKAEQGVCFGYSRTHPGNYEFLLSNGLVVVRSVVEIVFCDPFDWPTRKVIHSVLGSSGEERVVPVPLRDNVFQDVVQAALPADPVPLLPGFLHSASDVVVASSSVSSSFLHDSSVVSPSLPVLPIPPESFPPILPSIPSSLPLPLLPFLPVSLPTTSSPVAPLGDSFLPVADPVAVPYVTRSGRTVKPSAKAASYVVDSSASLGLTFSTQRDDEIDLDEALVLFAAAPLRPCLTPGFLGDGFLVAPLVSSSLLVPVPSTKGREQPLRAAIRARGVARLVAPTAVEVAKQLRLGALGKDFSLSELPRNAVIVRAHVLYKIKADDRDTCRIAAMGDQLPPLPSADTFAAVVSEGPKVLAIAAMQAHCQSRGESFLVSDADVVGGFLHIPLHSPVPMYLLLPENLPHPLAGRYVLIHHAIYGLRESNRLFSLEMTRILTDVAGFVSTNGVSQLFVVKADVGDPGLKCVASVTVDDVLILTNSVALRQCLLDALTARFGPLTVNLESTVHTGVEFTRLSTGGVLLTQDRKFARAASVVGVAHLPSVQLPGDGALFSALLGEEAVPVDSTVYSSLMGKLVQFCKTRHEIRLAVSYLCSFNISPMEGHYRRAIHLLRYLASTPGMGCVFFSELVELVIFSDAAFGIFLDGLSSTANLFCIGTFNAPFAVTAKSQSDVATCPMTAEYYAAGAACKDVVFYRQLLTDLGWPPAGATVVYVDNKTMISLVVAPVVSTKSRHIEIQHHYIRQLSARSLIRLEYVASSVMRANVLTKVLTKVKFLKERDCMFNRVAYAETSS